MPTSCDERLLPASTSRIAIHHHRAAAIEAHRHGRSAAAARIAWLWAAYWLAHGLAHRLLNVSYHRSSRGTACEQAIPANTTARGIEDQHRHRDKQQSLFHLLRCPCVGDAPFTWFARGNLGPDGCEESRRAIVRFLHTTIAPDVAFGKHGVVFLPQFPLPEMHGVRIVLSV